MSIEPIDFAARRAQPRKCELHGGRAQLIELARDTLLLPPAVIPPRGTQMFVVAVQGRGGGHTVSFGAGFRDVRLIAPGPAGTRASWLFLSDEVSLQYIGGAVAFE